jgi:hypothetical protein
LKRMNSPATRSLRELEPARIFRPIPAWSNPRGGAPSRAAPDAGSGEDG